MSRELKAGDVITFPSRYIENPDPIGPWEGRSDMREVSRDEWVVYRHLCPDGDWSIKSVVGAEGEDRYFVPVGWSNRAIE